MYIVSTTKQLGGFKENGPSVTRLSIMDSFFCDQIKKNTAFPCLRLIIMLRDLENYPPAFTDLAQNQALRICPNARYIP